MKERPNKSNSKDQEYYFDYPINKIKSRLIPNTPTPKQIQDQLDRARQIPQKEEVRRCRKQGRLGK